jgi:hypothetical protein
VLVDCGAMMILGIAGVIKGKVEGRRNEKNVFNREKLAVVSKKSFVINKNKFNERAGEFFRLN